MSEQVYIVPLDRVAGPQAVEGAAVRLGGSLVFASQFAIIRRSGGKLTERWLAAPDEVEAVVDALPSELGKQAQAQWSNLSRTHAPLALGSRTIALDQPQVMGILNVTPDSFSDGGRFLDDPEAGRDHAAAMLEAGAAIIDIGGESTRPGAAATWEGDEIERVIPAVRYCAAMGAAISIDTRRAGVLEAALSEGAQIANDISALRFDPRSVELVAAAQCPVVLMHAPGHGEAGGDDPHQEGRYANVLLDVFDWLRERRDAALAAGIKRDNIILDPGIGFGKSLTDNLALINGLALFHALGQPLLVGASRKRMIGALSKEEDANERLGGSIALANAAMNAGVHLLRVHDVAQTVQARNVWRGLRDAALTDMSLLAPEQ